MKVVGVIPARYNSTRFPGKPLADIHGKSMIQRVYEQARAATGLSEVVIATDDQRIFDHAVAHNLTVMMTSEQHQSGTDRCAEVVESYEADVVVNIQGDEPFLQPSQINQLIGCFKNPDCDIATLVTPFKNETDYLNPNRVKCVTTRDGRALYFSRSPIPYYRSEFSGALKHIGLYAYKRSVLVRIAKLKQSPLELAESLEQLRWLENGYSIYTVVTDVETPNVDTPEDLKKILEAGR